MKTPLVEFFILNTNARDDVRRILTKLTRIAYPKNRYRITVVDNNSTDGSREMLARSFPAVGVIKLTKNHGMSALNYGFRKTRAAFCFILDDDSYFEPSSVMRAVSEFERDTALGILACNITNPFDKKTEYKYMPTRTRQSVDWCDFVGGGVVIRTAVFRNTGYFNPDILIYGHEADFSLRTLNAGWKIKFAPSINVHRNTPPNVMNAFRMSLGVRNFLGVYWRFLSVPRATIMTILMLLEYLILALRSHTVLAYVKGVMLFLQNIPYTVRHRTQVKPETEAWWARLYPFSPRNTLLRFIGTYRIHP